MPELPINTTGHIWTVLRAQYTNEPDGHRGFTLRVHNKSGLWIDVVVDRPGGNGIAKTGHFEDGQSRGFTEALQLYLNGQGKITRWRPGIAGIPGNGGGEVTFDVPANAQDVFIELETAE